MKTEKWRKNSTIRNLHGIFISFQSFFHVLVHNSEFCETWINENMHFINWNRDKGCTCDREAIDVCGCSPLVIKQHDFDERIVVRLLLAILNFLTGLNHMP